MKRRVAVTIEDRHVRWVNKHRINLSKFLRNCLDREIYVDARVWKITSGGTDYKVGTHLRIEKEEWEKLPSNRLGKYIEKGGARYYLKEMRA